MMVLGSQYSQLCALCEHPETCDYPDNYSGYEGALRCLAHNGGQVAFTKVIFVRKFFGVRKLNVLVLINIEAHVEAKNGSGIERNENKIE